MPMRLAALAALASAMILVGSSVAVGRLVATTLPICFASMVRFALASICLAALVRWREPGAAWPKRRTLAILAAQALCGSFLFTVCLLYGLRLTSAAKVGVMAAATPAAVALMGAALFRDKLSLRAGCGIVATTAGIVFLNQENGPLAAGPNPLAGNLLVLCAVGFEAAFLLLRRAVNEPLSPLVAAMWVSVLGFGLFAIPGFAEMRQVPAGALTPAALTALAYYGLGVTAAAYILWFYGVVRVDAATAGTMTGLMPVTALLSAALVCGETIGTRELVGCVAVVAGIVCLAGSQKKQRASGKDARRSA